LGPDGDEFITIKLNNLLLDNSESFTHSRAILLRGLRFVARLPPAS
jgi:hypothetical protein